LNNITTFYLTSGTDGKGKDSLIYFLPNLKHLILRGGKLPSIESELIPILNNKIQQLDIYIEFVDENFKQLIETSYVYFSNVEHIHFRTMEFRSISKEGANIITEVLKNLKNLKTSIIYNLEDEISFNDEDWNKFIEYFNMNEIMKTSSQSFPKICFIFKRDIRYISFIQDDILIFKQEISIDFLYEK
jgi:hypothetical protein